MMDEEEVAKCCVGETRWQCSVCFKILSRKQTLQCHLYNAHNIKAGNPIKKYKTYEVDDSVPVPRTTAWRYKGAQAEETEGDITVDNQTEGHVPTTTNQSDMGVLPENVSEDGNSIPSFIDDVDIIDMEIDSMLSSDSEVDGDTEQCSVAEDYSDNETPLENPTTAPLYVIPPSADTYSSRLTNKDHPLLISAFATRHNLSDTAMKDLLNLVQLYIPAENIAEKNITKVKEQCGFDDTYLKFHLYCEKCKKLFSKDIELCQTPGCEGQKSNTEYTNYFVTADLKLQLREILEREKIWQIITDSRQTDGHTSGTISDITSGAKYIELQKPGGFLYNSNNITFSMFIDGVPLFKSSSTSIWPVYMLVNEISARQRFLRKNMLLWGVWQGRGKPKMNMFLRPFVTDLIDLYNTGMTITVSNETYLVKAMLLVATMDLQARAYVCNMTQHNGEYGCLYCQEPGETVASGKAYCRSYPVRDVPADKRTAAEMAHHATIAQQTQKRSHGVYGESVLSYLPHFSLPSNIVIDYMHGILLGVTKKLLDVWFNKSHKQFPYSIHDKTMIVDNLMKKINPPYLIHRNPRILTDTYHHWKASELRNWLLFFSLPCLNDLLPTVYLKHFALLVEATYLLLSEGITEQELDKANSSLKVFVASVPHLYGDNFLSLNMHNLLHICECVRQWGPLWAYSCFPYESFNGEIKRSIHGKGNVCKQIFWAFQGQKRVLLSVGESDSASGVTKYVTNMLNKNSSALTGIDAYQCTVITEFPSTNVAPDIFEQVCVLHPSITLTKLSVFKKIRRNGYVMYSKSCGKVKTQNSYTIAIQKAGTFETCAAVEVQYYILENDSQRVYAVGNILVSCDSFIGRRVTHIHKLEKRAEVEIVNVQNLNAPMVVARSENQYVYAALFPNTYESD